MERLPILCGSPRHPGQPLEGTYDLQGHRGARGKRPENTIPAFEYCIENHMTTIELDTNLTKDNQLIVNHDTIVNGKICMYENGVPAQHIPIKDLTVAELKKLDCGAPGNDDFPEQISIKGTRLITLPEFFTFVADYERANRVSPPMRFNIETKFRGGYTLEEIDTSARLMVETIETAKMQERATVQSFVLEVLPRIRALNARIRISALFEPTALEHIFLKLGFPTARKKIVRKSQAVGADILSPHYLFVDKRFVRFCHQQGLKILPWVVNDEQTMERLFNWGVDGIISDYPDRLYRVYTRQQKCRPPEA